MNSHLLSALFAVDEAGIRGALQSIDRATRAATKEQLEDLHRAGVLPTGILHWLLACRVSVG